jgi:hypothetical protein
MRRVNKSSKVAAMLFLLLLATMLLAAHAQLPIPEGEEVIPPSQLLPVSEPGQAGVVIFASVGGTTDPAPGYHQFPNGTLIELTATPQKGFRFLHWVIEGGYTAEANLPPIYLPEDFDPELAPPRPAAEVVAGDRLVLSQNPLYALCGYGWTFQYQAVFEPATIFGQSADAIINVVDSVGGTTDPAPGTYNYPEGTTYELTATPAPGFEFQYWVVSGDFLPGHGVTEKPEWDNTVFYDNPLLVACGFGYTYTYQPLFTPIESAIGTGISTETFTIVVIVLVIIAVLAVAVAVYMSMRRSNK